VVLGRPGIPCRFFTEVKQFATIRSSSNVTHHLPTRSGNTHAVGCSNPAVMPLLTTKLSLLLRTPQQRLPMLSIGQKIQGCSFPLGISHLIYGSLGQRELVPAPNGISIGSAMCCPTHSQTHRPRYMRHL